MITTKHLAALLGFAFAAAWIGFDFGNAILCLIGAGVFYAVAAFLQGELDVSDIQTRLGGAGAVPEPQRARARARVR
ncbi:MAG: hypothetical protein NVSMB25_17260 [Thermoleophilaceae bacterium]